MLESPLSSPPSSPSPTTITLDDIQRARAVLEARAQTTAAGEWIDDHEDVVVAYDVSQSELYEVPEEWLNDVELEMRADGAVIAVHRESHAHDAAREVVVAQARVYALPNTGMYAATRRKLQLGGGRIARPDVALLKEDLNLPAPDNLEAIALFEIEHNGRSGTAMIRTAAQYLTHLSSVECVVFLTLFPPRKRLPERPNDLHVPALALAFRRAQGTVELRNGEVVGRVRVAQLRSFGNAGIQQDELTCFTTLAADSPLEEPLANVANLGRFARRAIPGPLDMVDFDTSLRQARATARQIGQERVQAGEPAVDVAFRVDVPAPLAAIQVDLIEVFYQMMLASEIDRAEAYRKANAAVAAARGDGQ